MAGEASQLTDPRYQEPHTGLQDDELPVKRIPPVCSMGTTDGQPA